MRPLLVLSILFCILSGIPAKSQNLLDAERGFLGYRLEAPPDSMPGKLHPLGKTRKLYKFRPEPDSVWCEGVYISSLRLFFFQNKLHSIVIKTEKDAETEKLLKIIQRKFGAGKPEDQFEGIFTWQGSKVFLRYEKNYITGEGVFSFYSYKVQRDYEIAEYKREYGE